ncbi:MAG: hypothetical protein WA628_17890 [Terriglobales bacterium]
MALELVRMRFKNSQSAYQTLELLPVYMVGVGVIFASLGMGEAVYRLLFSDYDGAKDRLPIETFFGLIFAWLATSFVRSIYQHRKRTIAKLNLIWDRNHQIRAALEAISPHPHTSRNQQSIRVIREELDRIEGALKEVLPR